MVKGFPSYEAMRSAYLSWPRLLRDSFRVGETVGRRVKAKGVSAIVVCGMGGSGIVGDYVAALAWEHGGIPVVSVKGFQPPAWARSALVIAVSYSGNTVETVACYRAARRMGARVVAVSSGGRLAELAERDGVLHVPVTTSPAARTAFAQLLGSVLGLLRGAGVLDLRDLVEEAANLLEKGREEATVEARSVAAQVHGRIPLFLACIGFEALAWRAKNEFNENAKIHGLVDYLPEWGHNGVEGWEAPAEPSGIAVIGFDPGDAVCSELLAYAIRVAGSRGAATYTVSLKGRSMLAKLMWGTLVAGLASLELASMRGIDPLETRLIKEYRSVVERILVGEST